jgi:hypothetical protein
MDFLKKFERKINKKAKGRKIILQFEERIKRTKEERSNLIARRIERDKRLRGIK